MTREELREWGEHHGYVYYRCRIHGPFWSDSGPHCEYCADEDEEESEEDEDE